MPIDIDTFDATDPDSFRDGSPTNAERVMWFLSAHPEQAFTQSEIRDGTGVKAGSISVVLSRLEDRDLVRHKGQYWALGDRDDIAAYLATLESTRTANDRYGEEDVEAWLEHAIDEEDESPSPP